MAALVLLLAVTPVVAQDPLGDPARGKEMVLAQCTVCHFAAADQTAAPRSIGPSFYVLAEDPAAAEFSLRVFLMRVPLPVMPNFVLTEQEGDDLAAYILGPRENGAGSFGPAPTDPRKRLRNYP